jgi:hypothetical protein
MNERLRLNETTERLSLDQLRPGDVVTITTGTDDEAWRYVFTVTETGRWPDGTLKAVAPDGSETETVGFSLHGAGNWTTRQQNPVQKQDKGFTSYFDSIYIDGCMTGRFEGHDERVVFDQPGQKITSIGISHSNQ